MEQQPLPLTLAESRERARLVAVSSYSIDLDLTRGPEVFRSRTVVRFSCTSPGAGSFVEIRAAHLVGAALNGRSLEPDQLIANRLTLEDLQADNELVVEADLPYVSTGDGMHRFVDPLDSETYVGAYLGGDNAQRVFANFDQPDLKAPISATVTAPPGWTVVSNGRAAPNTESGLTAEPGLTAESGLTAKSGLTAESARWQFATTPPLSTYLFVVVAGPLHSVVSEHRGIPFGLHCRRSLAKHLDAEAAEIFAITHACFDRYGDMFDEPYPFDSYDQAFVPELNWGALETPGCITFRDDFVYRSAVTEIERQQRGMVIAHEMAHMWFGDLVTMRWWDDLWLSESFAEYMGFQVLSEATRFTETWTDFAMARKTWGYDADQRPSTHPVAPEAEDVADTEMALAYADGITYAKGASVLRQLAVWLGEDIFLAGINVFLGRHRFSAATLADLLEALGVASGLDVHRWADRWLRTTGVDTLHMLRDDDAASRSAAPPRVDGTGAPEARLHINHPGLRPHRLALGLYDRATDDSSRLVLRRRHRVTLPEGITSTAVDLDREEAWPDLVLLNDQDLTYAKVRLDASSTEAAMDGLRHIADPLSRAVVWTAFRDRVRDRDLLPTEYLSLVNRHLATEDDLSITQGVLGFARQQVIDRYLDPPARTAALESVANTCRAVLERADQNTKPGLRLVALRASIEAAISPDDIRGLHAYLTDGVPDGPSVDANLRWRILLRLSVLGAVGRDEIENERVRDTTGAGPEGAARCLAALPSIDTKNAAWEAMFSTGPATDALSVYLITATAEGFWQPEQRQLLAPFVERYFPAAVAVAARRGPAVASAVGRAGFPAHVVEESTLRAGEECLAQDNVTEALRRRLVDHLDDLGRALHVRSLHP